MLGPLIALGPIGAPELLIILAILALLFGASRIRDLGSALGGGIREFRREAGKQDDDEEKDQAVAASTEGSDEGGSSTST